MTGIELLRQLTQLSPDDLKLPVQYWNFAQFDFGDYMDVIEVRISTTENESKKILEIIAQGNYPNNRNRN